VGEKMINKTAEMEKLLKEFGEKSIQLIEEKEGWILTDIRKEYGRLILFFNDLENDDNMELIYENGVFKEQWRGNSLEISQ
jgi:predicted DNA-binding antitoxin AbrB/MazE fold protein